MSLVMFTLSLSSRVLPFLEQRDVGRRNDVYQRADRFIVESRLDHPPLTLPELSFTHHQAIAEKEADTFDGLTFFVVSPVDSEDMIDVLGVADDIHVRTINRGPVDASESIELILHPAQQILRRVVLLGWPWRIRPCSRVIPMPPRSRGFRGEDMNSPAESRVRRSAAVSLSQLINGWLLRGCCRTAARRVRRRRAARDD